MENCRDLSYSFFRFLIAAIYCHIYAHHFFFWFVSHIVSHVFGEKRILYLYIDICTLYKYYDLFHCQLWKEWRSMPILLFKYSVDKIIRVPTKSNERQNYKEKKSNHKGGKDTLYYYNDKIVCFAFPRSTCFEVTFFFISRQFYTHKWQ